MSITIAGIPTDATLTDANNDALAITNGSITLTSAQLAGLTFNAGEVTQATLQVTATNIAGVTAASAPQTITLTVNPASEAPSLTGTVLTASGVEGTAIPLTITATPVDGDDVLSISVTGVPLDATLSAGTNNGGGNWTLTAPQLVGLTLNAGLTSGTLHVTATNTTSGEVASTTNDIVVTVTSSDVDTSPETPSLAGTVLTASGNEGTAIPLTITATPVDGDDVLSISISGVPLDATLSAGTNNGGGNWTLTAPQLVGLKLNAGETSGTLHVTATNTTTGEVASSAPSDIAVTVNPLAENPVLGEASASVTVSEGSQGNALGLTLAPVDSDDVLSVSITGVPSDATLSAGTNNGGGNWTLSAAQLAALGGLGNLTLNAGETSGTLTITATKCGEGGSAQETLALTVNPAPEAPSLAGTVLTASGVEGTAIPLTITATPVDGDDVLSISVSGVPLDATLSAGTNNGGGNWTLTAAQLVGLKLNAGETSGTLHVTATNTTTGEVASSATSDIAVTVNPLAENPVLGEASASVTVSEGSQGNALGLTLAPVDSDDVLSVSISGVPSDATLNAGTFNSSTQTWTLSAAQLAALGGLGNLTLNAGETSGTLTITATNAEGGSAQETLALTVNPAPEAPSLAGTVLTASGNEGTAIPLTITATPVDGDDVLSISISGVPLDATLSAGTNNGGGNWTLTAAQLVGLKLNAGETSGTLHVTATNTTTGEVASSATSDIAVTVNPLAENPVLGEASASVTVSEGSQGNALGLTLAPVDSDDVLSVSISGVPSDATLNAGTFNSSTQTWTLSAAQLAALGGLGNLTLNAGETSGTLTITATNAEGGSAQETLALTVNPAPEAPSLAGTVLTASGNEGTAIPLTITATPVDGDDVLSISISGVPLDATLSAGTNNGGGNWTLTTAQLVGLSLNAGVTPGTLHVTATNTTTGEVASSTSDIVVTVTSSDIDTAPEAPSLTGTVLTASGVEGTAIPLTITATPVDGDDVLSISISGVPLDATLSAGTNNGGGNWTLTAAQLVGLKLNAGETSGTLHVTATNTTTGEVASSATSDIAVTVNPLAENPVLGEASASVTVSEGSQGNALGLTLAAVDSDDVLSVSISGVPSDATLNAGTFNSSTQTWTLSAAQLAALGGLGNLTLNAGETSGTLTITATNAEGGSAQETLALTVNPAPEAPSLAGTVLTASGVEGTAIPLTITATPVDGDDVLSISISGVPLDATLSAGTNNGGGNWTLTAAQLVGLKLNAGETSGTLHVTATNTTTGEVASSAPSDIAVTVNPLAENPVLGEASASVTVSEGSQGNALGLTLAPVDSDDVLSVSISGVPSDATLIGGHFNNSGGTGR